MSAAIAAHKSQAATPLLPLPSLRLAHCHLSPRVQLFDFAVAVAVAVAGLQQLQQKAAIFSLARAPRGGRESEREGDGEGEAALSHNSLLGIFTFSFRLAHPLYRATLRYPFL